MSFLFLRFLSLGIALVIGISLVYYFRFYYTVGTIMGTDIPSEMRPLPAAIDDLADELGRNEAQRRRKALVEREKANPQYVSARVPFGVPLRRLMFKEEIQCGLCFEKFIANE